MALGKWLARQAGHPSGLLAGLFGRVLNRTNAGISASAVEVLQIQPTDRVLDIGFGGGLELALINGRATEGLTAGIEISDAMLRRATKRFKRQIAAGKVELKKAGIEAIPYPDDSFDKVCTVNTIYFWPDTAAGLAEILRVLRPGGTLVIGTRTKEEMEKLPFTKHGFKMFTEAELWDLVKAAGLADVEIVRKEDGSFPALLTRGHKK